VKLNPTNGDASSDASTTTYTPGQPTDWDVQPTTIAEALDELAARVRVLEP